jgi:2-polyprenyl-3-methyl-5-hydroxy-6-metoxy-1,4-benzoquinol methylase
MGYRHSKFDSSRQWDLHSQRRFWNDWDTRHLQEHTLGDAARRRGEVVLNLIGSLNLRRPRVLEIGCGNGWLAERLQMIGTVHGVDLSDASIEEARRRVPGARFEAGDVLQISLPSGSFDLAVSLETLSHVVDQRRFFEVAAKALRSRGHLIIATQNRWVYLRRSDIGPPAHGQLRRWLTRREILNLLSYRFKCLRIFTMEPAGDQGFLRIVNSRKLNSALRRFFSQCAIQRIKERLGFGQTIVVLAEKRE